MWNLWICDDEPEFRSELIAQLERFSEESGETFSYNECSSGEALVGRIRPDADLILLDIKMDGISGMDAAREIRRSNPDVCIVFLTSMVQYAVEGYSVHAWGFMQKPLKYAQLRLQMADVMRHLHSRHVESISLQIGRDTHKICVRDILYIEVLDHKVALHCKDNTLDYYGTITELEKLLQGRGFSRCHKSFMVNLQAVRRLTADGALIENGECVPVSKRKRKEFQQELTEYLGSVTA